ncbi:unnamed protein product [Caenorhabditis auriculariae]|uniref:Small-subunit processome Utp12 domain-containing protein n=1 Tax=Caenorhabditis auriculariae TaxID=2777116 RepID=A0A8S1GVJ7_9PELO|nr:unnamed protein product [Caenorhabditis auriculariae]
MVKDKKRRSADTTLAPVEATPTKIENGLTPTKIITKINGKSMEHTNGHISKDAAKTPTKEKESKNDDRTLSSRVASSQETTKKQSTGGSLCVLLTQGIMANDEEKINSVLRNDRSDVIHSTLREIQTMHLLPLLKAIELRLRTRKAVNIRPWLRWSQALISLHMPYLSSLPNLEKEVGGLLAWMRSRADHQKELLSLQGKLSIISDQIQRRTMKDVVPQQPLIIFNNDVDSDPDDLESLGSDESGESSEEDWWDDKELKGDEDDESENEIEESDGEDDDSSENGNFDEDMQEAGASGSEDDSEVGDEDEDMEQG